MATVLKTLIKLPWVYSRKEAVTKCKKGIKNIKQKNTAQKKLGFRDISIESPTSISIYILRGEEGGR